MQGKYRIYTSYTIILLFGIFLFVLFIFFVEKKDINNTKEVIATPTQTLTPLNKELEEPIKMIDDIEAIETNTKIYKVIVDTLNIREKPSTESKIIKQYINGNNIEIISINDGWGELKSGGFAYMELLEENKDKDIELASDDGIATYIVKVNRLNIREKPSIESKIINQMTLNQKILIEKVKGKWGKVVGGGFAYMGGGC